MRHVTRVFPKIRMRMGDKPTPAEIVNHGFDIRVTAEIKAKLDEIAVGEFLMVYPATDSDGQIIGLNIKCKPAIVNIVNTTDNIEEN